MKEQEISKKDIFIISSHSNWQADAIETEFKAQEIYATKNSWLNAIEKSLLALGAVFCLAGIIFLLAYNWHLMHKFLKLGLIQVLVTALILVVLFVKTKPFVKDVMLFVASFLVGALFSVFGQIYQTGADAYDFFLGWTVFILLWAVASNFAPLWLLLLALINTTFILYMEQVGPNWSFDRLCIALFLINSVVYIALLILDGFKKIILPTWFSKIIALAITTFATVGLGYCILEKSSETDLIFSTSVILIYASAIFYSIKIKSLYLLCIIPLSIVILICCLIVKQGNDTSSILLLLSFVVIACITLMVRGLISLNKHWNGKNA